MEPSSPSGSAWNPALRSLPRMHRTKQQPLQGTVQHEHAGPHVGKELRILGWRQAKVEPSVAPHAQACSGHAPMTPPARVLGRISRGSLGSLLGSSDCSPCDNDDTPRDPCDPSACFLSTTGVSLPESSRLSAEGLLGGTQDGPRPALSLPRDFIWARGAAYTTFPLQATLPVLVLP